MIAHIFVKTVVGKPDNGKSDTAKPSLENPILVKTTPLKITKRKESLFFRLSCSAVDRGVGE